MPVQDLRVLGSRMAGGRNERSSEWVHKQSAFRRGLNEASVVMTPLSAATSNTVPSLLGPPRAVPKRLPLPKLTRRAFRFPIIRGHVHVGTRKGFLVISFKSCTILIIPRSINVCQTTLAVRTSQDTFAWRPEYETDLWTVAWVN